VGVEFSEALHRMAEANIRVYRRSRPKCFAIQSVCVDAAEWAIPGEPTVFFLYNPFRPPGVAQPDTPGGDRRLLQSALRPRDPYRGVFPGAEGLASLVCRSSVLPLVLLVAWLGVRAVPEALAASPPPRLFFSDLDSGPKSGNTDTSLGQTAGQDGAIVSIWAPSRAERRPTRRCF
jgi:hypothetical protein